MQSTPEESSASLCTVVMALIYLWKDKTYPARTQLIMSWKAFVLLLITIVYQSSVQPRGKSE